MITEERKKEIESYRERLMNKTHENLVDMFIVALAENGELIIQLKTIHSAFEDLAQVAISHGLDTEVSSIVEVNRPTEINETV